MASSVLTVPVNVPEHPYSITIQPGLLGELGEWVGKLTRCRRVGVITDTNVEPLYMQSVKQTLEQSGFEVFTHATPAGEQYKTLGRTSRIVDAMLEARIERSTPVIALGGGIVGDMTGFASAMALRGVPFIQVPTTLLSMVDASVGGKTGVDHRLGKNLIGAFHQPMAVLIDPAVLKTLPERELRGGLAECIKHEIIRDSEGFDRLEKNIHRALALDVDYLGELVAHNVGIKAKVVEADPFEKGERAHLNFGHTFGHVIESESQFSYSHGEAVGLGMIAAARAAVKLGLLEKRSCDRIVTLVAKAGLPVGGMTLDAKHLADMMIFDKKVKGGRVRFILPDKIGHVIIRDDVPMDVVVEALKSLT
jgi:3-dehydroquinate synthase